MNHKTLAEIAARAYDKETFNIGECECLIEEVDGVQVVAFRGTEIYKFINGCGWLDVVRDARLLPWYDDDIGLSHSGFLKGGKDAIPILVENLSKAKPVVFTGHSLGGALSLICAIKLLKLGFKVVEWVGFGSPKVLLSNREFHSLPMTNYRNGNDIVPLLPNLPLYRHNYPVVNIGTSSFLIPNIEDHNVNSYVESLP